jgi:fucose 4-O-acetylase-like acetyltransferase
MFLDRIPPADATTWTLPLLILILLSGLGYALATVGMKMSAIGPGAGPAAVIVAGFLLATLAEVVLLREGRFASVYLTIIGVETLLVLAYAALIGEGLSLRGLAGGGLVLAGLALVSH